jgi:hypothetical protein
LISADFQMRMLVHLCQFLREPSGLDLAVSQLIGNDAIGRIMTDVRFRISFITGLFFGCPGYADRSDP